MVDEIVVIGNGIVALAPISKKIIAAFI